VSRDLAALLFSALDRGDTAAARATLGGLSPLVDRAVRQLLARRQSLVRRARLDDDDVVQHVLARMLDAPPRNHAGHPPVAVLVAWARSVALHHLLAVSRRTGREQAASGDPEAADPIASISTDATQERRLEATRRLSDARACAEACLSKHRYLRELFYAVADDPDLSARELAVRIGLLGEAAPPDEARRAEQYVWKLRERVHLKLAECMNELGEARRRERARLSATEISR
jgi:DNA-directed RNA polymerase specialized sigma24 family protein